MISSEYYLEKKQRGRQRLRFVAVLAALLCLESGRGAPNTNAVAPVGPRRVVRQYALTASFDQGCQAPTDWRLLGSMDAGQTWDTLDARSNEVFSASQRRVFSITNNVAYNVYRLKVDRGSVTGEDWYEAARYPVQLTALELIGDFVGVTNPAMVVHVVAASAPHPLQGPPENAFDGDATSRWSDFGLMNGDCWIECRYALEAETTVTNISQVQLLNRLALGRDVLSGKGLMILSNLEAATHLPLRTVTGYGLTSANDVPTRDPRSWRLLGSVDGGKSWATLDVRTNELFTSRFQRRVFQIANPQACALYRLQIDAVGASNEIVQLAEIEPLCQGAGSNATASLVVSALTENPPRELAEMAFDGDPKTKWLSFEPVQAGKSNWVQWQYVSYDPDLPVINLRHVVAFADHLRLMHLFTNANSPAVALSGYALTAAADWAARDPKAWRLLGSNDRGRNWELLDARTNELFSGRSQRRRFVISQPGLYSSYRLQIDSVVNPETANSVQLAEFEPLYANAERARGLSVVVSAQGDNEPAETVEMLFDHDPGTKWLDFAGQSDRRASWIEWQYVTGESESVLSLKALRGVQAPMFPAPVLRIDGVVISCNTNAGILTLLDGTGIQSFRVGPSLPLNVLAGDRVQLSGRLKSGAGLPRLGDVGIRQMGRLKVVSEIRANEPWQYGQDFIAASVTGTIKSISENRSFLTLRMELENGTGQVEVNVLNARRMAFTPTANCRFCVDGVVQPVLTETGEKVPGIVWAATANDLAIVAPTATEWATWQSCSIATLTNTNLANWSPVRVRGAVVSKAGANFLTLGEGGFRVGVRTSQSSSFSIGANVDAVGFLTRERGGATLNMAYLRSVAETTASVSNEEAQVVDRQSVARLAQVRELLQRYPGREFTLRVRGVITYIDMGLSEFYLQDGSEGLEVSGMMSGDLYPLMGYEGNYVELPLRLTTEGYAIACGAAKFISQGRMPAPGRHSWDHLMAGKDDFKWVEVEGTVTEVERQRLTVSVPGGQLVAWVNELPQGMQDRLMGAAVRMRGVCAPVDNSRGQKMGVRLLVPSGQYVEIISAPPANPFDLPLTKIAAVLSGSGNPAEVGTRLVKISGVVTYHEGNTIFVQDGANGLRVYAREPAVVQTGGKVEVVGLAEPDGFSPKLSQAVLRNLGPGELPPPNRLDPGQLESHDDQGQQQGKDATRVEIDAVFLAHSHNGAVHVLELQHAATRKTFCAFVPGGLEALENFPTGSKLRLHGVFKARTDLVPDVGQVITSFEIYVNAPADIVVTERPAWWTSRHTFWLLGGLSAVLVVALAWVGSLRRLVRKRTSELEAEILQRERMEEQVEQTHAELVVASRQAGMAEVATSVLHNVGNVLNSVNVSTHTIAERVRHSRLSGLRKAVQLLRQQGDQLGAFFDRDERGEQMLQYLEQLAQTADEERSSLLEEAATLGNNVEHIKGIVAMQQNYARVGGLLETVQLGSLIEDALRLNANALARREVEVVREVASLPPMTLDRHKVLQILVNLLSNAKQACDASRLTGRQVIVKAFPTERQTIQIEITDNGIGIAPEHLTRVFNQGFTTKKNGHGFGLHSSALAAKQLGGSLTVRSAGLGTGATFTLELPLSPPAASLGVDLESRDGVLASF